MRRQIVLKILLYCLGSISALFIFSLQVQAKDLGKTATVYPIVENDLMVFLQKKLADLEVKGGLEKLQNDFQNSLKKSMDRPQPVGGLSPTLSPRSFYVDFSVEVKHNVQDEKNNTLIPKGTKLNLLETGNTSFVPLLFYNADNQAQAAWALKMDKNFKGKDLLILVGGSVFDQMKIFRKPVYFDQGGLLTVQFKMKQVPAIVTQKGNHVWVQEVLPE